MFCVLYLVSLVVLYKPLQQRQNFQNLFSESLSGMTWCLFLFWHFHHNLTGYFTGQFLQKLLEVQQNVIFAEQYFQKYKKCIFNFFVSGQISTLNTEFWREYWFSRWWRAVGRRQNFWRSHQNSTWHPMERFDAGVIFLTRASPTWKPLMTGPFFDIVFGDYLAVEIMCVTHSFSELSHGLAWLNSAQPTSL